MTELSFKEQLGSSHRQMSLHETENKAVYSRKSQIL